MWGNKEFLDFLEVSKNDKPEFDLPKFQDPYNLKQVEWGDFSEGHTNG